MDGLWCEWCEWGGGGGGVGGGGVGAGPIRTEIGDTGKRANAHP